MKKRLIFILGLGLSFLILPFLINTSSILRIISVFIGIILVTLSYSLKQKRSILLIIVLPLLLISLSYGLDTLLIYKLERIPIYSIEYKSNKYFKTYNSLFYRVYDCNKTLVIDYGYEKSFVCENTYLEDIDINTILLNPKDSYKMYKNKFIKISGKISKISGTESIELAYYTTLEDTLNGYVNFNLDNTLRVNTYEDLSNYRIYDYISVVGRVSKLENNTLILEDVLLIPSSIYSEYTYQVIKGDEVLSNLEKEKGYYYFGIEQVNVIYNEDNIYELSYLLTDEKLTWDNLKHNLELEQILGEEDNLLYNKYVGDNFILIECSDKKIVVNKDIKKLDNICEMELK